MKYIFNGFLLTGLLTLSSIAFAEKEEVQEGLVDTVNAMSRYISPCRSWSYASDSRGYVCNFYDMNVEVIDANEVRRFATQVDQKLRQLESRIQALERSSAF